MAAVESSSAARARLSPARRTSWKTSHSTPLSLAIAQARLTSSRPFPFVCCELAVATPSCRPFPAAMGELWPVPSDASMCAIQLPPFVDKLGEVAHLTPEWARAVSCSHVIALAPRLFLGLVAMLLTWLMN